MFVRNDTDGQKITTGDVFCEVYGLAGLVSIDHDGKARIIIENRTDEVINIAKNEVIGTAWQADNKFVADTMEKFPANEELVAAIDGHKNKRRKPSVKEMECKWQMVRPMALAAVKHVKDKTLKGRLLGLFRKYVDVFSKDKFDFGRTDQGSHTIRLKTEEPVFTKQFPLPLREMDFIREHVTQWEKMGLVEKANSPYNSPIFCVAKKGDAGWRLVLDYRRLNAQSHVDRYSIRGVDECLITVGAAESKWFSTLDLTSGFWQLPLDKKIKHTTAFTVPGMGQYQWTMAPMGLQGSPASFSRLMDKVLFDTPNTVTFIDDILVHSKTQDEQMRHLDTVFSRLTKAGLKLNLPKCFFMRQEVAYLGHTLTAEGIKPGMDKWKALLDTKPPTDITSLRSFLGLANFFRKFVADFSRKAAPLHALTRQDSKWHKGPLPEEAVKAFNSLKTDITTAKPLRLPSSTGSFHLFVDAATGSMEEGGAEGGLGACLLQDNDGVFQPVAFASRGLERHEQNYTPFLIELAAACYAMEHFAPLLRGRRFYLYTDNKPAATKLQPLSKMTPTQIRTHHRLTDRMEEFEYDVRYTPGGPLNPADYLSRTAGHTLEKDTTATVAALGDVATNYPAWSWRDLQEKDTTIQVIKKAILKKDKWPARYKQMSKKMVIKDGLVGYDLDARPGFPQDRRFRLLPPEHIWKILIQQAHDETVAGHGGEFRTSERLRQMFWWPGFSADVAKHIKKCEICDRAKKLPPKQSDMPIMPLPVPQRPNQRIHVDLWGPHKDEAGAAKYVCVMTDALTGLVKLKLLDNKAATSVAEAILEWCAEKGLPEEVVTDQGKEFCNEVVKDIWNRLKIKHVTTTPYHPRANGAAERFNRTMLAFLTKTLDQHKENSGAWPQYLPSLMIAYNSGVHKGSRSSPFEAMFGYSPNHPYWPKLEDLFEEPKDEFKDDPLVEAQFKRSDARNCAQTMLHLQATNMMRQQDKAAKKPNIWRPANGEKVWVRRHDINVPNPMLVHKWETAVVLHAARQGSYKVQLERKRKKQRTISLQEMRKHTTGTAEEDLAEEESTEEEHIAAIQIFIEESAQELIKQMTEEYKRKGVQVLMELTGQLRNDHTTQHQPFDTPWHQTTQDPDCFHGFNTPTTSPSRAEMEDTSDDEFHTPQQEPRPTTSEERKSTKKPLRKELVRLMRSGWKDSDQPKKPTKLRSGRF